MERPDDVREGPFGTDPGRPARPGRSEQTGQSAEVANDLEWNREFRSAVRFAGGLLAALLVLDLGLGEFMPWRIVLWLVLALLVFSVLCPAKVSAGRGWLASRRFVREQRVRTDLLVSVRFLDGVSQRLMLRDALGGLVEIDARVLVRNPPLWVRLDEGARKSAADGVLRYGAATLERLAVRVERTAARDVFRFSGLE